MEENIKYILGLDVSTSTIGISLFEDKGTYGKLKLLHHVTPIVKPKPKSKMQELFEKAKIKFHDCDMIFVVAAAGGGTGSGALPIGIEIVSQQEYEKLKCLL